MTSSGKEIRAKTCVLTTGTFLNGKIRLGDQKFEGGRSYRKGDGWEPPTNKLSLTFRNLDIEKCKKF